MRKITNEIKIKNKKGKQSSMVREHERERKNEKNKKTEKTERKKKGRQLVWRETEAKFRLRMPRNEFGCN